MPTEDRRDRRRRKACRFCEEKVAFIDYKDDKMLKRYTNDRGKIIPRRVSGTCARHQRQLTLAVKRCRLLGLLAFSAESIR